MSFWTIPIEAPKNAVNEPIKDILIKIDEEYSKIGENLIIKKTPAVTIVAECNNADTGVGPSIASGNQVCNPIWEDFAIAPTKRKNAILFNKFKLILIKINFLIKKKGYSINITVKSNVLK